MKTDSNEMITDDGDNIVAFDMAAFLNPTSATNRFIQEQATAKFFEMVPAVEKVLREQDRKTEPFDFSSLLA